MKLGVLGGTFDPFHNAHLKVAEAVMSRLNLAYVLFVPAGQPWLKVDHSVLAAEHRLEMVRLAIQGKPHFRISTVEVERAGPSYTVDTLAELRRQLDPTDEVSFILGWDSLSDLPRWHEPSRLVSLARLVAVCRPGSARPDLESLEASIPGIAGRVAVMDKPAVDISSSDIRQRVARGLSIKGLVPAPVESYIKEHNLYRADS